MTRVRIFGVLVFLFLTLAAGTSLRFSGPDARAATITVETTEDLDGDECGEDGCSLRQAITTASDGDTIQVPEGVYTLTKGRALTISKDILIVGDGRELSIIEGATSQFVASGSVFVVEAGAIVTMTGLEIRHGFAFSDGGGINNRGTLTIKDSWVHDNFSQGTGGGIWNRGGFFGEGKLTIEDSQIDFNQAGTAGGGVYTEGTATITSSFIDDNKVSTALLEEIGGGGIFNFGRLDITDSSVGSNTAVAGGGIYNNIAATLNVFDSYVQFNDSETDGGGLYNIGTATFLYSGVNSNEAVRSGGGIFDRNRVSFHQGEIRGNTADNGGGVMIDEGANSRFVNATVSGNTGTSQGGGVRNTGEGSLINVTITENESTVGGGLFDLQTRALRIANSIVHGNVASADGGESPDCFGTLESDGHNLMGDLVGCFFDEVPGDQVGVDPMLVERAINGAGTDTYALAEGSPAIDAASTHFAPGIDQRGVGRPYGSADIGAYEASSGEIHRVTTTDDSSDDDCATACSLRGAIVNAKQGDTVIVPPGTYTVDPQLTISKDMSLTGYGEKLTILQAAGSPRLANHRVLEIGSNSTAVVSEMTIRYGDLGGDGGGVANHGNLTLWRVVVRDNTVFTDLLGFSSGGGIVGYSNSSLSLVESTVRDNLVSADNDAKGASGGGIRLSHASATIDRSTIYRNRSDGEGGGLWSNESSLHVINSTIAQNKSDGDGAGARVFTSASIVPVTFEHVSIISNEVLDDGRGAGLWGDGGGPIEVGGSIFAGNLSVRGPNCYGPLRSGGYNLVSLTRDCTLLDDPTTLTDVDFGLGSFAKWSGPTITYMLNSGGFAIDGVPSYKAPPVDQRGVPRIYGDADIGSFESDRYSGTRPELPEPTPIPQPTATPEPPPVAGPEPTPEAAPDAPATPTPEPTPTPTPTPTPVPVLPILSAGSWTANPGGTVRLPLLLSDSDGIAAMEFAMNVDSTVVELTGAIAGSLLDNAELLIDADTPGIITFNLDAASGLSGSGSLVYLTFTALGDEGASTELDLSPVDGSYATDKTGANVSMLSQDGAVEIATRTLSGDNDGDNQITELDAVVAFQMALGIVDEDLFLDVDGDGAVTTEDAREILRLAVSGE